MVVVKRTHELGVEVVHLLGAAHDVVSRIIRLVAVCVEETRVPLGGGVGGQIAVLLLLGEHSLVNFETLGGFRGLLKEAVDVVGLGEQIGEHEVNF